MRVVTRGDMDGLACAVIFSLHEDVEDLLLIHPQDITDGRVEIREGDALANVPYDPRCSKWFDHHQHTATPAAPPEDYDGAFGPAPSAARLVYEYYGGEAAMPQLAEMVREADRLDSADLTFRDVLEPRGWIQLGFTLDSRSGLGDFESYFANLVDLLRDTPPIEEVLRDPEVARRCRLLAEWEAEFREVVTAHSRLDGNVVITDLRPLPVAPIGNRFLVFALFPEANVGVRLQWGPGRKFVALTLGHSIFNRTCQTDLGELAARYGGGGHRGAASVPLVDEPDQQIQLILAELRSRG